MTRSNSQYKDPINLLHRGTKPVNQTSSIASQLLWFMYSPGWPKCV